MKSEEFTKLLMDIESMKLKHKRVLTSEETSEILDGHDNLSHLQKRKIITRANSGVKNMNMLYAAFMDCDEELNDEQKEFLTLSISEVEKELSYKKLFIDGGGFPSNDILESYVEDAVRLAYLKSRYGIPLNNCERALDDFEEPKENGYSLTKKHK